MVCTVLVLLLLVMLLHGASPAGAVLAFGEDDAFRSSVPNEQARNGPESHGVAPRSSDSPSLDPWRLIGNLPESRSNMGAVVWGDYLFILGGGNNSVIRATIGASGRLGAWQSMSSMSHSKQAFGTAVSGNNLYTLGGYASSSSALKAVERTIIQDDGTLAGWQAASAMSVERPMCSAIAVGNYVYVLGGESSTTKLPMSNVDRVEIQNDGSLGVWQAAAPMMTARSSPSVVTMNGYIYAIGGVSRDTVQGYYSLNSVERAQVNPDGSLGDWQFVSSMMHPRMGLAAVVSDCYIYAIGGHNGLNDNPPYSSVERALVNPDGSLGSWQSADAIIIPRWYHAAAVWNGHLYAIGGVDPIAELASIEGTVPPPPTFLPLLTK